MSGHYKTYDPDQLFLLPPSLKEWLPEGYLAYFVSDVVDELDLSDIEKIYSAKLQGQPPYHPALLVKLLFYAYCMGIPSSRKIERETYEDIYLPQGITPITTPLRILEKIIWERLRVFSSGSFSCAERPNWSDSAMWPSMGRR